MPAASPASGSGRTAAERRGCGLPSGFDRMRRVGRRALHGHRACRQRADRPDPFEIVPVGRVGSRTDRPLDREAVARDDLRIGRQRGGHAEGRRLAATSIAVWRSAGRLAPRRPPPPRTSTVHGRPARRRPGSRGWPERETHQQQRRPDEDHDPGRVAMRDDHHHATSRPAPREHETGHAHRPADDRDRPGGGDRSDRQPAAARHVSEPSPAA